MKKSTPALIVGVLGMLLSGPHAWATDRNAGFTAFMQSSQGEAGSPDIIAYRDVSKDDSFECIKVESYPQRSDDGAACLLRFSSGEKRTLKLGEKAEAVGDGVVYLECLGDKPTACVVGVW